MRAPVAVRRWLAAFGAALVAGCRAAQLQPLAAPDVAGWAPAEVEAVKLGARIVSNEWACGSGPLDERDFSHRGITYIAAAADSTAVAEPAAFDRVAAIGGTSLSKQASQYSEFIWSGSAGGCAAGIKKPKWQHDRYCSGRIANDAAAALVAGIFGLAGGYSYGHYNECVGWGTPDGIGAF